MTCCKRIGLGEVESQTCRYAFVLPPFDLADVPALDTHGKLVGPGSSIIISQLYRLYNAAAIVFSNYLSTVL